MELVVLVELNDAEQPETLLFAESLPQLIWLAAAGPRALQAAGRIADGVFTVDPDWRITFFNRAAQEITGIDWRLIAALGFQESHWDPLATSPTGVRARGAGGSCISAAKRAQSAVAARGS